MRKRWFRLHIGMRTLKTTMAIIVAMVIVDFYGATTSKLIFAMLGAMAAVQPTFKESVESCLSQIVGVLFGAMAGLLLISLPMPHLVATGIGVILVITLYNVLHFQFSPSLACFVVVMLCTSPGTDPFSYAFGRIWDTAIGLLVGLLINILIAPYDNSRKIHAIAESLDKELLLFLEDMFDGDAHLPDPEIMEKKMANFAEQLTLFSNQKLVLHLRRQKEQLEIFHTCEKKGKELLARMELLRQMGEPGELSEENRERFLECGICLPQVGEMQEEGQGDVGLQEQKAPVSAACPKEPTERDIVMNYHVRQVLKIRSEMLTALRKDEA